MPDSSTAALAEVDRRVFLKFLGVGLTGVATGVLGPIVAARGPMPFGGAPGDEALTFAPIGPRGDDELILPAGFGYDLLIAWGEPLPGTSTRFGYNCDYTAFLPLGTAGNEGLLWVNHEYASIPDLEDGAIGVWTQTFPLVFGRTATIEDEQTEVGASVLHIRRDTANRWRVIASPRTRRYDARSPMRVSGPALTHVREVAGTMANCSGCLTPWGTVLTCEENYQDFVSDDADIRGRASTGGRFNRDGAHYGWVVEADPADPAFTPVKHTMLGRFRHENVAIRTSADAPVIAYMGDDRTNGHVYKFVSTGRFAPGRTDNRGGLLANGRLYAAVFHPNGAGEWRELAGETRLEPNPQSAIPVVPKGAATLGHVYADLGAIVTDAFRASNLIGATPTGRPEDVEVHPHDQSVYIAFTEAATAPDHLFPIVHGQIWRLVEEGDGTGQRFTWMRWKSGGPNEAERGGSVFAAPDNLSFDRAGNMWVMTDIRSDRQNADERYTAFRNNGMFFLPTAGDQAGMAFQFASAPCESELTGPSWTPDERTLFLSVQHPGEAHGMRTATEPRGSNWPSGTVGTPPRPAVVVIGKST